MIDTAPSPIDLRVTTEYLREYRKDIAGNPEVAERFDRVAQMLESLIPLAEHLQKMEEAGVDPSAALPQFLRQLGV